MAKITTKTKRKAVLPPALRAGDKIGIVAPASQIDEKALKLGRSHLHKLGYEPMFSRSILDSDLYFAGTGDRRTDELQAMIDCEDVRAIVCARGGYGTNYLVGKLDLRSLRKRPKIFVGYSDITTLLTWMVDQGLVVFHGPMVTKDFAHAGGVDLDAWRAVLGGEPVAFEFGQESEVQPLRAGEAKGVLYGGCLSMLVASLGTKYEIQTDGKLLFIEDVGAKPYQIDRMLMQLKLAGKLKRVRGIVFGEMLDCVQPGGQAYTLQEVVSRVLRDLDIPIAYGFPSGHVSGGNIVLPFGVEAQLEVGKKRVRFSMDAATIA